MMIDHFHEFGIDRLTPEDRLELIGQIWDSLAEDQMPVTEAQRTELVRRLEAHKAHPEESIPWEQVKSNLLAKVQNP